MYSRFQLAKKYCHYYLVASNGRGHGVHSPFVYDFIKAVLNDTRHYHEYDAIENLRRRLKQDIAVLEVEDMGAGSVWDAGTGTRSEATRQRRVADIAAQAAKPRKWGQLLFRIARYYQPHTILELGTSLGLSTAYLAKGAPVAEVWTIEGAGSVAAVAGKNFESLGLNHIHSLVGGFDELLTAPVLSGEIGPIDMAFIDGNHRYEPTLRYFDILASRVSGSSVLVFDDIHWSEEMEEAWVSIQRDERVLLTIDLFFVGLIFIREEFKVKQDFVVRF